MKYLGYNEAQLKDLSASWTAKEISQQPASWLKTIEIYQSLKSDIDKFLGDLFKSGNVRVILTGAGTSAFIGGSLAPYIGRSLKTRVEAVASTDIVSNPNLYLERDTPTLLVSFARSGNSPESIATVQLAEKLVDNCYQLVVTCNKNGELYRYCESHSKALALLTPQETNDQGFAMTSSFTSMMALCSMALCHGMYDRDLLENICRCTNNIIASSERHFKNLAQKDFDRVVFLGSGGTKSLAQEAALKLLELTDGEVVSMYDSPLGFRHGPKSIVNSKTLIFLFMSNDDYTRKYDLDLLSEIRADAEAGHIFVVSAIDDEAIKPGDVFLNQLDDCPDEVLYLPYIVCAQIFAFYKSLSLGKTPDSPSQSGTVNRVVKGVNIYPLSAESRLSVAGSA